MKVQIWIVGGLRFFIKSLLKVSEWAHCDWDHAGRNTKSCTNLRFLLLCGVWKESLWRLVGGIPGFGNSHSNYNSKTVWKDLKLSWMFRGFLYANGLVQLPILNTTLPDFHISVQTKVISSCFLVTDPPLHIANEIPLKGAHFDSQQHCVPTSSANCYVINPKNEVNLIKYIRCLLLSTINKIFLRGSGSGVE